MIDKKKISGLVLIGLAGVGLGGVGMAAYDSAHPYTVTEQIIKTVEVPQIVEKEVIKEVEVEVIKEVEVEVIKEVEIDNGNLDLVLDHIYDNDGNINYLTEDLDDDEIEEMVGRIVFVNDIKQLAIKEVEKEGMDELDKEMINGTELDEDDIDRFKVYDDDEDIIIDDIDFEDFDADVFVDARFEQDDVRYKATFKVEFKDGIVDDIDLESIELRD